MRGWQPSVSIGTGRWADFRGLALCLEALNPRPNIGIEMTYLVTGSGLLISKAGTIPLVLVA